jgi:hypothetical protein
MSTQAQMAANRANAQLSTGPVTPEGKAKSSLNAIKSALTGRTVLLPAEDSAAYEQLVKSFYDTHEPLGDREKTLVQSLADTQWRLLRIPSLELGIYAIGRLNLAESFPEEEDPQTRAALIEAQVFLTYQRELKNLGMQESRLRRHYEKDTAELLQLQADRRQRLESQLDQAAALLTDATERGEPFDPREFGFEFSTAQIEERVVLIHAQEAHERFPELAAKRHMADLRRQRAAA